MAVILVDSFNHYDTPLTGTQSFTNKWDFANQGVIVNNAAIARTGPRCLQIAAGNTGPFKNLAPQQQGTNYTKLIMGVALNFDGITTNSDVLHFNWVAPTIQSPNIIVVLNLNGSFSVFRGAGDTGQTLLGTSATLPFVFTTPGNNVWNYLECKCFFDAVNGSVELRFAPPGGPMSVILSLTGIKTVAFASAPATNQVGLLAAAGIVKHCYMADFYLSDWSDGSDYLGGVKIYHSVPFANGAPVNFLPLAGSNFSEVNEVPPDGPTSYNSSGAIGAIDQYQHNVGNTPANSSILAVQHIMDALTDTGARSITSVVNGVAHANSVFLTNNFAMYLYQYDKNPATAKVWSGADFPSSFGPEVTA